MSTDVIAEMNKPVTPQELAALREVADVAREVLKHIERHGTTTVGRKLREALKRLDGRDGYGH